jgi:branched-chain amino acid transport system ATP-binding protein
VRLNGEDITRYRRAAPQPHGAGPRLPAHQSLSPTSARSRTCGSPSGEERQGARPVQPHLDPSRAQPSARASISPPCRWPDRAEAVAATLPHGDQRKLEVAILLALEPDIFMFDEPTAGMSVDEVPTVLAIIADIKARGDKTILLVEHKMDVVRSLSDRIVVLHQGSWSPTASRPR